MGEEGKKKTPTRDNHVERLRTVNDTKRPGPIFKAEIVHSKKTASPEKISSRAVRQRVTRLRERVTRPSETCHSTFGNFIAAEFTELRESVQGGGF